MSAPWWSDDAELFAWRDFVLALGLGREASARLFFVAIVRARRHEAL
jgi:hypothetical protein